MRLLIRVLIAFSVLFPAAAYCQCGGQAASGYACGNGAASTGFASFYPLSTLFDRGIGSGQGTILNRSGTGWVATVAPTLGLNGGTGGSIALEGATSGAATISVPAAAGSVLFQLPSSNGTNLDVLTTDGSGHLSWTPVGTAGAVTSVGLAMPGIFAVTGSPVTSTGTLTASLNAQSANMVWAGPSSGLAAAPTFRALVGADLPAPTTGSLGGVEANNAVSHQWINAINTSGVPQLSQPAFPDISGTAAPTQLPTPTATTLGGIESYAAVTHQWINSISTAGAPSSSQPSFADISGTFTSAQCFIATSLAVGCDKPDGTTIGVDGSGNLSALINGILPTATRAGDIIYWNGSAWAHLAGNNSGTQFLQETSAGVPSWVPPAGSGTVTSVGLSNSYGITLGGTNPVTTSGTISTAVTLSDITNSLGANVTLNSSTYTDGPSVAQGSTGTWLVVGKVDLMDTAGGSSPSCKLWDGATVIDSAKLTLPAANEPNVIPLSGYLASPAGNLRISCIGQNSTTSMEFNLSGNSKDSTISAIRIQ